MLHKGKLPLSLFDVPRVLKRKHRRKWVRKNKRMKGRSIDERPDSCFKTEIGHWEFDTVVLCGYKNVEIVAGEECSEGCSITARRRKRCVLG